MSDIQATLQERHHTHGDFEEQAHLSDRLVGLCESARNWSKLSSEQREAVRMMAVKFARLLTGNPHHVDHWHDLAGYATLGELSAKRQCDRRLHAGVVQADENRKPSVAPWERATP